MPGVYLRHLNNNTHFSSNILYQANITPFGENSETKVYYGICETTLN